MPATADVDMYRAGDVCPATGWYREHIPGEECGSTSAYVDDLGHDRAVRIAAGTHFPTPSRSAHVWRIATLAPAAVIRTEPTHANA